MSRKSEATHAAAQSSQPQPAQPQPEATQPAAAAAQPQPAQLSTTAAAAVANLTAAVAAFAEEYALYWHTAAPYTAKWRARIVAQIKDTNETATNDELTDDFVKGMATLGSIYVTLRKHERDTNDNSRALLHYLWRLCAQPEFVRAKADLRSIIIRDFGLRNTVTGQINVSLQKKLNAAEARPICVAVSIVTGEIPVKRDETLGTFVNAILKDNYRVADTTGSMRSVTAADLCAFVGAHWETLKGCTNVTAMRKYWESLYGTPNDVLETRKATRVDNSVDKWVTDVVPEQNRTLADLARANVPQETRDRIMGAVNTRLESQFQGRVISTLSPLHVIHVALETANAQPEALRVAIAKCDEIKATLTEKYNAAVKASADTQQPVVLDILASMSPEIRAAVLTAAATAQPQPQPQPAAAQPETAQPAQPAA